MLRQNLAYQGLETILPIISSGSGSREWATIEPSFLGLLLLAAILLLCFLAMLSLLLCDL